MAECVIIVNRKIRALSILPETRDCGDLREVEARRVVNGMATCDLMRLTSKSTRRGPRPFDALFLDRRVLIISSDALLIIVLLNFELCKLSYFTKSIWAQYNPWWPLMPRCLRAKRSSRVCCWLADSRFLCCLEPSRAITDNYENLNIQNVDYKTTISFVTSISHVLIQPLADSAFQTVTSLHQGSSRIILSSYNLRKITYSHPPANDTLKLRN